MVDLGGISPPVEEFSNSEDSSREEVSFSEIASTQAEVTVPNFGNFNNSFNSLYNMKFEINKYDGTGDFGIWRRKVKALLSQQKILRAIESPDKLPDSLTLEQKDDMLEMALGTIILNLSDNVLREIYLKERLFSFKMDPSKGLGQNLDEFKKMTTELANAGENEKLSDENEAIILLNSLPNSFKDVKAAIKYGRSSLILEECLSTLKSKDLELKIERKDGGQVLVQQDPIVDQEATCSDVDI
ncbi:hypothetical protein EZV62_007471 [Acer yangbiense]|uniref:Retrotransposon Copia-like N-terminal domain-containing protein n=1 Tax=Acer yangbiense TaxID=1000413 RepID=A0A5C7ICP3_9ROSI|nr:hypothetical protein EZV62_007471 [Acer yangbiense]